MSHEAIIHQTQVTILKGLLFTPEASFSALQKTTELDSDHFKFHIHQLVEKGYITKNNHHKYSLTVKGKEYANRLDTDQGILERQPKSAVIIVLQDADKTSSYKNASNTHTLVFGDTREAKSAGEKRSLKPRRVSYSKRRTFLLT